MKPKDKKIDESKYAVVLWKLWKKQLLHNFPNCYQNGKTFKKEDYDEQDELGR